MIRGFLAVLLPLVCAASGVAAEQGQLDSSQALFTVMAAINAAGYDADLNSPVNSPLRAAVRREIAARNPPSLAGLKAFFAEHRQKDYSADLTQYISFALCIDGPPGFAYRYRQNELPPDVAGMDRFRTLLATFSKEANLEELWAKSQPAFDQAIARYHAPALAALTEVNGYLRSSTSGALGTRFQVYLDLLGAPNQVHTRSYKNDYFIVVTPSEEPRAEEIRHAYLHYQVDSLSIRYAAELEKKRSLIDYAQGAPALEPYYKDDFGLLATESLIKAIEARLAPSAARPGLVSEAVKEGYILAAAFADALPAYEKQEQSLRFYYPEMVKAIDLNREVQRLDKVEFLAQKPARKTRVVPAERKVELPPAYKTFEEAERLYTARELDKAKAQYQAVLQQTEDKPLHAKSYYGLARVAVLQNDPEGAVRLFEKTLESSPDPQVKAWALVYLGRLSDASGEREQAIGRYKEALTVEGATNAARQAAEKGLAEAFRK